MANNEPLDATKSDPQKGGPSFSLRNRVTRAIWDITWLLFASWTPSMFHPWRRLLLKLFGARIEGTSDVRGSAKVWLPANLVLMEGSIIAQKVNCYNMAPIYIGKNTVISQGAHLCAGSHDINDKNFQLIALPISIGNNCWVAAEAFVGPGVTINDNAILGARAVTFKNLAASSIYVGNPATKIRHRQ